MTGSRLAALLDQATPPEWEFEGRTGVAWYWTGDGRLLDLIPDAFRLLVDMAAKLADHVAHCELCGGNGWYDDYQRSDDGERKVRVRCDECGWAEALLARFAALDEKAGGA